MSFGQVTSHWRCDLITQSTINYPIYQSVLGLNGLNVSPNWVKQQEYDVSHISKFTIDQLKERKRFKVFKYLNLTDNS